MLHALANILTDRLDAHAHISTEGANAHISTEGHAHISTEGSNAFADRVDAVRRSSMQHPQAMADALAKRLDALPLIRANQRSSEVNQRSSEPIRGHQSQSEVIRGDQRTSESIRGHQSQSEAIRGIRRGWAARAIKAN